MSQCVPNFVLFVFLTLLKPFIEGATRARKTTASADIYSQVPIKRTVLLSVLLIFFSKNSIKRTVQRELRTQVPQNDLFLLNVLFQIFVLYFNEVNHIMDEIT